MAIYFQFTLIFQVLCIQEPLLLRLAGKKLQEQNHQNFSTLGLLDFL